jgi:hypothetical protein
LSKLIHTFSTYIWIKSVTKIGLIL